MRIASLTLIAAMMVAMSPADIHVEDATVSTVGTYATCPPWLEWWCGAK